MACFSPLVGWVSRKTSAKGRRQITFRVEDSIGQEMEVPCGRCVGCNLEKSRQWAIRIVHEASVHEHNHFVTLTYDNDHLPQRGSLCPPHLTKFWKRLRKNTGQKLRYFAVGEYGAELGRPHYHAVVHGLALDDLRPWKRTGSGELIYRSDTIERSWKAGFSSVGKVSFESAAYVARYSLKKKYGEEADSWYTKPCEYTGEVFEVEPEFTRCSRRPGIGADYLKRYMGVIYDHDRVVFRNRKGRVVECKPPRYYDRKLDELDSTKYDAVKAARRRAAKVRQESGPSLESQKLNAERRVARLLRTIE